jgi:hypothetical protein
LANDPWEYFSSELVYGAKNTPIRFSQAFIPTIFFYINKVKWMENQIVTKCERLNIYIQVSVYFVQTYTFWKKPSSFFPGKISLILPCFSVKQDMQSLLDTVGNYSQVYTCVWLCAHIQKNKGNGNKSCHAV